MGRADRIDGVSRALLPAEAGVPVGHRQVTPLRKYKFQVSNYQRIPKKLILGDYSIPGPYCLPPSLLRNINPPVDPFNLLCVHRPRWSVLPRGASPRQGYIPPGHDPARPWRRRYFSGPTRISDCRPWWKRQSDERRVLLWIWNLLASQQCGRSLNGAQLPPLWQPGLLCWR